MHRRKLLVTAREGERLRRLDRLFGAVGIEIDIHGSPYLAEFAVALIKHNSRPGDVGVAPRPHKPAATLRTASAPLEDQRQELVVVVAIADAQGAGLQAVG